MQGAAIKGQQALMHLVAVGPSVGLPRHLPTLGPACPQALLFPDNYLKLGALNMLTTGPAEPAEVRPGWCRQRPAAGSPAS